MSEYDQQAEKVSRTLDADVVLYSGAISENTDEDLIYLIRDKKNRKNVLFVLTTYGGSADSAYRIARCLQAQYREGSFILFVDSICKSAGTLIALGADEIIMSEPAELGPLDVQLSKADEIDEQISGMAPIQALNVLKNETFKSFEDHFLKLRYRSGRQITTKMAADIATRLTVGLFNRIYCQIDPMRLGETQRALLIAEHYGIRLASNNVKNGVLDKLIADYPSHGFVIDQREAKELFEHVRSPSDDERLLCELAEPAVQMGLKNYKNPAIIFTTCEYNNTDATEKENGDFHAENPNTQPGCLSEEAGQNSRKAVEQNGRESSDTAGCEKKVDENDKLSQAPGITIKSPQSINVK